MSATCTHCGGPGIPAPRYCADCSGDMVLPGDVPQLVEAVALLRECKYTLGLTGPHRVLNDRLAAFLARHGGQG